MFFWKLRLRQLFFWLSLKSTVGKFLFFTVLSCILVTAFLYGYVNYPGPLRHEKQIFVPRGTSVIGVGEILKRQEVVRFAPLFPIMTALFYSDTSPKAGEYRFLPDMTPLDVLRIIHSGKVMYRRVTIPEGLTTYQILKMLAANKALDGDLPDDVKEGELFPETYHFLLNDPRDFLVSRMRTKMKRAQKDLWNSRVKIDVIPDMRSALILASIIERETSISEEKQLVASVFINRLRKNMRLQSDPTVIYAITKGKGKMDRMLTRKDWKFESDFNTYRNKGLPPGPICNPGYDSLYAVLHPAKTDYIYFMADGEGGHNFSKTLDQHNRYVADFKRKRRNKKK